LVKTAAEIVVQDPRGNCGGLFVDRDAALRFVRAENGYRTPAVVMVSGNLELNTRPIRARYPFLKQPSICSASAGSRDANVRYRSACFKLSGYAPALPTPFNDQDNSTLMRSHTCDLQIANGASALVVCGTTGEAPTLSRAGAAN
jgi:Dihydrodipicolinate synthetase family